MKKISMIFIIMIFGFGLFAQSKVIQKSNINDVNIRWVHNQKSNSDYIELCRSPKFDEVVYRFVADEYTQIEGIVPVLETMNKALNCIEVDAEYIKIQNPSELYSFGLIYMLFTANCDYENAKKYYNLDWCSCLVVYNDFSMDSFDIEDILDFLDF